MLAKLRARAAAGFVLLLPALAQQARRGEIAFEPYSLVTYDGQPHAAELGRLLVPENRRSAASRLIQIAFVRLKSTAQKPAAPIVYLSGGPGVPGIVMARVPVYYSLFDKLRQVADVILLDQRGCGMSSPNLNDCPAGGAFPADAFEDAERFKHALADATGNCARYWRSKGADVAGYNTEESADDVEDLRLALGAAKISLLGHSYGTELALAVIRRHGDAVERAALASVEGPGDHGTMPSVFDLQLKKISRLVASNTAIGKDVPDLVALFQHDAERLDRQPATITATRQKTKQPVSLTAGGIALRFIVERMLPNGRAVAKLPALLESVNARDDSLLQERLESLYNDFDAGITLMGRTMDCSARTPPSRLAQTESEGRESLFGDVIRIDMAPEICQAAVGDFALSSEYFAPLFSAVPTLFLSGTLDANTPPMKAERIRWGFPRSTHIVVENGFHETLPAEEAQALVADFFAGQDVSGRHVRFEAPRFATVDEAKRGQGRPAIELPARGATQQFQ